MKLAIIADEETREIEALKDEFAAREIPCEFVPLAQLGLSVQGLSSRVERGSEDIGTYDGVFLQAPSKLALFIEPLLDELSFRGVYSQLKPTSFAVLANKPFIFTTLALKDIPIRKTVTLAKGSGVEAAIGKLTYPVIVEAFREIDKAQSIIITDESQLRPFIRSIPFEYNLLMIQEYAKESLLEHAVIGERVSTVERSWVEKKLDHSNKAQLTKASESLQQVAVRSARAVGADIATVRTIGGKVVDVECGIDFKRFNQALGSNLQAQIAAHYIEKLGGSS